MGLQGLSPPSFSTLFNNFPPYSSSAGDFAQSAVIDWSTQFPAVLSLPNFLLELDDLPKLVNNLTKAVQSAPNLLRLIRSYGLPDSALKRSPMGRKYQKLNVSKEYADVHLGLGFGLVPFLGDIQKLMTIGDKFLRRYKWILNNNGKTVTVRRSETVTANPKSPNTVNGVTWSGDSAVSRRVVGAKLTINLGSLQSDIGMIAALLHTTGFNNPVGIGWEAIPFSWLIDYAINMQSLVKKYTSTQVFPGQWDVRDGWTSNKTFYKSTVIRTVYNTYGKALFSAALGSHTTTSYNRSRGLATSQGLLLKDSPLSQAQFLNYAALFK